MEPAETFSDVVGLMEGPSPSGPPNYGRPTNLDVRDMYWGGDQTPFRVKVEGQIGLRRVTSVKLVDGVIVVEIE